MLIRLGRVQFSLCSIHLQKNNSIAEKHESSLLIASKNEHRQNKMAQSPFVNWSKLMVNLFTPLVNYQFFILSAVNFSKIKTLKHVVK